jgi:hypothetical protein
LENLGQSYPDYRPTVDLVHPFLTATHRNIASTPVNGILIDYGIRGFLRLADALKLYELAYCAENNVLEMGSAWGLSSCIIGEAIRDSSRVAKLISLEIDPVFCKETKTSIKQKGLKRFYKCIKGSAASSCDQLLKNKMRFGFAFIDHCHSYLETKLACDKLQDLLRPGGFVMFHDFNDERNRTEPETFGVYRAATECLPESGFDFVGVFGCSGVYRKHG